MDPSKPSSGPDGSAKQPALGLPTSTTPSLNFMAPSSTSAAPTSTGASAFSMSFNFPQPAKTTAPATAPPTTSQVATSLPATTSFSFGTGAGGIAGAASTSAPATSLAAPSLTATSAPTPSSTSAPTSTATTTAAAAPQAPNPSFNELEDMINRWTTELIDYERLFLNQATQINAWDRIINSNFEKLYNLSEHVEKVRKVQENIDCGLDSIQAQQKEFDDILTPLEKDWSHYAVDEPRKNLYQTSEYIDTQLKRLSEDLKETIDHINETARTVESVDPVIQIGRVLSAHMNSLQWIDDHTQKIKQQVDQLNNALGL